MQNYKYIIGIDEAGRGPLAGPVAVGAVRIAAENYVAEDLLNVFEGLKDSKKVTALRREKLFTTMKEMQRAGLIAFNVSLANNGMIDNRGIMPSVRAALDQCLEKLADDPAGTRIVLDGGLYAPKHFTHQETIVRGDQKEVAIMLAAIAAKVTRDHLMCQLAEKYPEYGFEKHKGYGTKAHSEAIQKHGPCAVHRVSFLSNILKGK